MDFLYYKINFTAIFKSKNDSKNPVINTKQILITKLVTHHYIMKFDRKTIILNYYFHTNFTVLPLLPKAIGIGYALHHFIRISKQDCCISTPDC